MSEQSSWSQDARSHSIAEPLSRLTLVDESRDSHPGEAKEGEEEPFDSRFAVVDNKPSRFFNIGRVFKTLWVEPAGSTVKNTDQKPYHTVGYGQLSYAKVRRFVVIRKRLHSSLCLMISTYGGQGAAKGDVRSQDHAPVYSSLDPVPRTQWQENITLDAFPIILELGEKLELMSRLDFGKVYTVEHNVRIQRVGRISPDHIKRLDVCFANAMGFPPSRGNDRGDLDKLESHGAEDISVPRLHTIVTHYQPQSPNLEYQGASYSTSRTDIQPLTEYSSPAGYQTTPPELMQRASMYHDGVNAYQSSYTHLSSTASTHPEAYQPQYTAPMATSYVSQQSYQPQYTVASPTSYAPREMSPSVYTVSQSEPQFSQLNYRSRTLRGEDDDVQTLDKSYQVRGRDYKKFFRVGRVFSTLWTEPSAQIRGDGTFVTVVSFGEKAYSVIRRFVVVRQGDRSCTCLPVTTYGGRGSSKNGLRLGDHGFIYSTMTEPEPVAGMLPKSVKVNLSRDGAPLRNPSMINYGKVYTVEFNVKVKDVGDLSSDSRSVLRHNFKEVFMISEDQDTVKQGTVDSNSVLSGVGGAAVNESPPTSTLRLGTSHTPAILSSAYPPSYGYTTLTTEPSRFYSANPPRSQYATTGSSYSGYSVYPSSTKESLPAAYQTSGDRDEDIRLFTAAEAELEKETQMRHERMRGEEEDNMYEPF